LAGADVRHLEHSGRGVRRVLRQEDHRTTERHIASGVSEGEVQRVAVALQVDARAAYLEWAVDLDGRLPRIPPRLRQGDIRGEALRPTAKRELRMELVEPQRERLEPVLAEQSPRLEAV